MDFYADLADLQVVSNLVMQRDVEASRFFFFVDA